LHPTPCRLLGHRVQAITATAIHSKYLGISSKPGAGFKVFWARAAQGPLARPSKLEG
jgi:hypothetical protein